MGLQPSSKNLTTIIPFIALEDIGTKIGARRDLTIKAVYEKVFNGFDGIPTSKTCIEFREIPKILTLTKTQKTKLEKKYSQDVNIWIGKKLTLVISINTKGNLCVSPQIDINYCYDKLIDCI